MTPRQTLVDLSHEVADGMATLPGLPAPRIVAHLDHAASRSHYDGAEFFLGRIDSPTNIGTYLDAPFHRFVEREDLSQVPLERLVGLPGIVVDAGQAPSRELDLPVPPDARGAAVLIQSGWDVRWGTDAYWEPGPFLSESFADRLAQAGVLLVGVDFWNVDDTTTRSRPVHTRLLGAGVIVVEHLCHLDALPSRDFRFSAPVVRVRRGASFPVRAFAELGRS